MIITKPIIHTIEGSMCIISKFVITYDLDSMHVIMTYLFLYIILKDSINNILLPNQPNIINKIGDNSVNNRLQTGTYHTPDQHKGGLNGNYNSKGKYAREEEENIYGEYLYGFISKNDHIFLSDSS